MQHRNEKDREKTMDIDCLKCSRSEINNLQQDTAKETIRITVTALVVVGTVIMISKRGMRDSF